MGDEYRGVLHAAFHRSSGIPIGIARIAARRYGVNARLTYECSRTHQHLDNIRHIFKIMPIQS
jgi:hypothetical protein